MNLKLKVILGIICCSSSTGLIAQDQDRYIVEPVVPIKVEPFRLSQVRLLAGSPFHQALELDARYIKELDPDRLLHRWRLNAGLEPKAPNYGGWEENSSHMLGHYLSACSLMYAATGEELFLNKVNYVVKELAELQQARGTGYVGGVPNEAEIWDQVAAGNIRSAGFDLNGGWVPWYMLHKAWDGLLDAYLYCGNEQAKKVVIGMSDWVHEKFKDLPKEKFQEMLHTEFGGMNESLSNVYAITGEKKYLELAYRFEHEEVIDPLAARKDRLAGLHANTQIPKVLGNARLYELTGNRRDSTVASFFWSAVVNDHSYANGGNSNFEYFSPPDDLSLSANTSETCNTYNMLKLTDYLYRWNTSPSYMDYYEQALYNHILASQNPETGMFCYYVPLASGTEKKFSTPFDSFWCCVGTGIENHAKYGESIYYKGTDGSLYVNLFIPSELDWKERKMKVRQETNYPESEKTLIRITSDKAQEFPIHIRYPGWATKGITVRVNGKRFRHISAEPGSYVSLDRVWRNGDEIEVVLPMEVHRKELPGSPGKTALMYGPVLLAAGLGEEELRSLEIPVLLAEGLPVKKWIEPVSQQDLVFKTSGTGRPHDLELIPFYQVFDQKQIVYWDVFNQVEWKEKKEAYEAEVRKLREIERRTLDVLRLGEMQPERNHNLEGENTGVGEYAGKKFRDAPNGGWFSFEMETNPSVPVELIVTYYGSDGGNRRFDIVVEGQLVATEHLQAEKPGEFVDHVYEIPFELTRDKEVVTVKFQAHKGHIAGAAFEAKLVKQAKQKEEQ